jgi:hypothetical protein
VSSRLYTVPSRVDALDRAGFLAGAAAAVMCTFGAFANPTQFFRSYLFAFLFWAGVALGCLSISMIHHLTGGLWGLVIRRILEA